MSELTTTDTVTTALRMFPGAVIYPNAGCLYCQACQLLTPNGTGVVTVHSADCPVLADQ